MTDDMIFERTAVRIRERARKLRELAAAHIAGAMELEKQGFDTQAELLHGEVRELSTQAHELEADADRMQDKRLR